jgi:TRAP-type C4-dicarboxylate transport system permease small subunit
LSDAALPDAAPPGVRRFFDAWHRVECAVGVTVFAAIVLLLMGDVFGRELLGPLLRGLGLDVGSGGIFGAPKIAVYLLVLVVYLGIGIASVQGAHLTPRVGFGWVPARWGPALDRIADAVTALMLFAAACYGLVFVQSSIAVDVRMPSLGWSLWPVQLMMPLGLGSAAARHLGFALWPALRPPSVLSH